MHEQPVDVIRVWPVDGGTSSDHKIASKYSTRDGDRFTVDHLIHDDQ